jgi:2-iminobutanoate/2-iminopropanoate deaminase
MSCEVVQTDLAPAAIGPYSQAVKAGPWLFLSGQLGLDPKTGSFAGDGFQDQAKRAMQNVANVLKAAGFDLPDVVSVDVYVTDISQFGVFNEIYGTFFSTHKPARAVVEVKGLPKGGLVEVKCTAYRS